MLANGTVRLQVDITKSAGVEFDVLLSSGLLQIQKVRFSMLTSASSRIDQTTILAIKANYPMSLQPDPNVYRKAMELLERKPEECIVVAAHQYELPGAQELYVQRPRCCNIAAN